MEKISPLLEEANIKEKRKNKKEKREIKNAKIIKLLLGSVK